MGKLINIPRENEIRLDHRALSSPGGLQFAMKSLSLSLSTDEWTRVRVHTRFHEKKDLERKQRGDQRRG